MIDAFYPPFKINFHTDFTKAFDRIYHNVTDTKLYQSGVRNPYYT